MEIPRLSDTRWVCRFVAVQLYKARYVCLIDALDDFAENSRDRSEAAEAIGLYSQLRHFSFLLLLHVFDDVLGVTKPLSDLLQAEQLELSSAMDLMSSTHLTISQRRTDEYFLDKIWKISTDEAQQSGISVVLPSAGKRKSRPPQLLKDGIVMSSTGARTEQSSMSIISSYRTIYYKVIDKVTNELTSRFDDTRELILAIHSCSPRSPNFLDEVALLPLAQMCSLQMTELSSQLDLVKNLVRDKQLENIAALLTELSPLQQVFPGVIQLLRMALTVPVTSASAERSFSALKQIKTYLRATMGQTDSSI